MPEALVSCCQLICDRSADCGVLGCCIHGANMRSFKALISMAAIGIVTGLSSPLSNW